MLPAWAGAYVGAPWRERGRGPDGYDCWGLAREVWAREFGLAVPSYAEDYTTTEDLAAIATLIHDGREDIWRPVALDEARAGDAALFRIRGHAAHVGVVLEPPHFLHVARGINVCVERWDAARWACRLEGVYRHAGVR